MRKLFLLVILTLSLPVLACGVDPVVSPDLPEINEEAEFRALVNCLSKTNTCVAPVIFIMSGSEDKWFSMTGFEVGKGKSL